MDNKKEYLTKQIITYMGNKRKIIQHIEKILLDIKKNLAKEKLISADGFSGSGIVSRLFKLHSSELYVNDIAGYSETINLSFLSNVSEKFTKEIQHYIDMANIYVDSISENSIPKYISKYWSPKEKNIKNNDRAYFTKENGERIDKYRYFIDNIEPKYKHYLLASLLVQCSIHNNTGGHFASFYKKNGIGYFGGKNSNDLHRITNPIYLKMPVLVNNDCKTNISKKDTNQWLREIPNVDVVYYDPPYNKHPYNIYYFLLDIINDWDIHTEIPDTLRGQPKKWEKSPYNSSQHAEKAFENLIINTKAKYIIVSYHNDGIISPEKMAEILGKKGIVELIELEHKTYNRLKGMAEYKRKQDKIKIKEFLWVTKVK
jgi:adenine-specific DNA-methyltransferase